MSGAGYERELRDILRKEGWVVFRSAGSHVADLIALKPSQHMIIEVKATQFDQYRTSKDSEQFDLLNNYARQGLSVYYYIRWKGKKEWSLFKLPLPGYPIFRKGEGTMAGIWK